VDGIVHKMFKKGSRLYLEITTADGPVTGRLSSYVANSLPPILGAQVRIRGTCGAQFNSANQSTGVYINIPFESEIEILQPPRADPFNIPVRSISDLFKFSGAANLGHRVMIHGVAPCTAPTKLFSFRMKAAPLSRKRSRIRPTSSLAIKLISSASRPLAPTNPNCRTPVSAVPGQASCLPR
jgi:hypothetical protein